MRRLLVGLLLGTMFVTTFHVPTASALSSDPKLFISGDNTFYAYVKAGETISAAFNRVNQDEPFDTTREDITISMDGPGLPQQKCVASKSVSFGQGCTFAAQTALKTGIWKVQFAVPATARTYQEVSPAVRWAKNLFNWNITVKDETSEKHGRIWTERYAIRQPAENSYTGDFINYYISEDGYIYKATNRGYNGQISTLSADSVGIRSGDDCVSAYRSTDVSDTKFSPALGICGNSYKLFFEEPAGDLPTKAIRWDDTNDWVRPNISRPSVGDLKFTSDKSADQQSGTISFSLKNFIGQYQIKIDVDHDGSFDGQSDIVLNQQMKKLSNDIQKVHFSGVDKDGQVIAPSQTIGIKVDITKVAEIHLVAADVEGRTGGLELVRLSGDNVPTTRLCWNDTELTTFTDQTLMTKTLDGRECPDSTGGLHGWTYATASWGNARYIDDWIYASAKLEGNNSITYPEASAAVLDATQKNWWVVVLVLASTIVIVIVIVVVVSRRRRKSPVLPPPSFQNDPNQPSNTQDLPPKY